MGTLHEKRQKRIELHNKMTKEEHAAITPTMCDHKHYAPKIYLEKNEARDVFNKSAFKAEYTKVLKDGTNRWYWTVRNSDYINIGFILGTPSKDQKQGNHNHNDPFKSDFDYMEIQQHEHIKE